MSTVYLSYDVASDRPVAVKLLADHLAHSREFVNRFYREARLSRLLSHRHLVRGLAAGFDSGAGKHYLVLEYVDGPTAHAVLSARGRFPVGAAVRVGIDIARALEFLHSRQYVHRDVKPDNVLIHPDGVAKLADLGLAKRLNDDPQLTSTTQGVGTSYYMAYEQALNANLVDGRSDVFALGATLYHLLAGEVPFPGATHEEVNRGKMSDVFRPVQLSNPHVPDVLSDIIAATLARDPRERFQSAGELAAALEETGLATPIPLLHVGGDDPPRPNAPTRADLKASPGPYRPTEPLVPGGTVSAPPRTTVWAGSGGWLRLVVFGSVAVAGVAAAVFATSSLRRPSPVAPKTPLATPDAQPSPPRPDSLPTHPPQ